MSALDPKVAVNNVNLGFGAKVSKRPQADEVESATSCLENSPHS
jgi:hypothetical protein